MLKLKEEVTFKKFLQEYNIKTTIHRHTIKNGEPSYNEK
jgi:hypothetical protein